MRISHPAAHPNITISGARSVRSPITVEIPASGGFSVKGPVAVEGASLSVLGRSLLNTSGRVNMPVSGPLKQFDAVQEHVKEARMEISVFALKPENYPLTKQLLNLRFPCLLSPGF